MYLFHSNSRQFFFFCGISIRLTTYYLICRNFKELGNNLFWETENWRVELPKCNVLISNVHPYSIENLDLYGMIRNVYSAFMYTIFFKPREFIINTVINLNGLYLKTCITNSYYDLKIIKFYWKISLKLIISFAKLML